MSAKTLSPTGTQDKKQTSIPNEVFQIIDDLITINSSASRSEAIVSQTDIVDRLLRKGFSKGDIYDNGWLDIEDHYNNEGWNVTYNKSINRDNGRSYFMFTKKD